MSEELIRILTLGESSVGKTSVILRFSENQFTEQFITTIGIDFKSKVLERKKKTVKVLLVDTSGQERFRNIAANYYKSADGILFVYDITQKDTLTKFESWLEQIKEKSTISTSNIILFGNKNDKVDSREITEEEGQKFADKYGITFMEGSAKSGSNITEVIEKLVDKILDEKEICDVPDSETTIKLVTNFKKENEESDKIMNKAKCC